MTPEERMQTPDKLAGFMQRLEASKGDLSVLSEEEQAEMCELVIEQAKAAGCLDKPVELSLPIVWNN